MWKTFIQGRHLSRHRKKVHGEKKYSCEECGEKFDFRTNLKRHLRTYSGEKHFSCDICGRAFGLKEALDSHLKIHTGEKPHTVYAPTVGGIFVLNGL